MAINKRRSIPRKSQTRDSHIPIILPVLMPKFNDGDMNSGIILPDPSQPGRPFDQDFFCTQILVVGTQDMYWILETNLKLPGLTPTNQTDKLPSGYIAKLGQNVPITVNLWLREGLVTRFRADPDLGGVAGAGEWKVALIGYYESVKQEDKT